jgi:hypothetical protein
MIILSRQPCSCKVSKRVVDFLQTHTVVLSSFSSKVGRSPPTDVKANRHSLASHVTFVHFSCAKLIVDSRKEFLRRQCPGDMNERFETLLLFTLPCVSSYDLSFTSFLYFDPDLRLLMTLYVTAHALPQCMQK